MCINIYVFTIIIYRTVWISIYRAAVPKRGLVMAQRLAPLVGRYAVPYSAQYRIVGRYVH